eukprot:Clim_evm94s225 gene=Clim_evmTU94s225
MSDVEEDKGLTPDVVTKYRAAGDIANKALVLVIGLVKEGASAVELCDAGDKFITEETGKLYNKPKGISKGIAFPTCINVNNCVCHFSPLASREPLVLKTGDVVKIDLGAHIDGYIAMIAHTVVVGASKENPVTGPLADTIMAAYKASEACLRLVKPDQMTKDISKVITKVANDYGVKPVQGMASHVLARNEPDSDKSIVQNPTEDQDRSVKNEPLLTNEVLAMDILMSNGDAVPKQKDELCTIYRRTGITYQLKMQNSRKINAEATSRFTVMPFTLRAFEDESKAKMGVGEAVRHNVMSAFPMFYDKEGAKVAQFKYTVLIMENGTPLRITKGPDTITDIVKPEKEVTDEEVKNLLAQSVGKKAKKKNKKKATGEGEKAAA